MNPELNNFDKETTPSYHRILVELKILQAHDRTSQRYNDLFYELAELMFHDFWNYCDKVFRNASSNSYYVSMDETKDILQNVLLKIFNNIQSYRGTCEQQARSWVRQIIIYTIRDSARKTIKRKEKWKIFFEKLPPWLKSKVKNCPTGE